VTKYVLWHFHLFLGLSSRKSFVNFMVSLEGASCRSGRWRRQVGTIKKVAASHHCRRHPRLLNGRLSSFWVLMFRHFVDVFSVGVVIHVSEIYGCSVWEVFVGMCSPNVNLLRWFSFRFPSPN
jgi:hypothetical protein